MGPVFRTRTTLPEKGVANVAKKGRSNPFSLYSSMTCASSPRKSRYPGVTHRADRNKKESNQTR